MRIFNRSLFFTLLIFLCFETISAQTEKKAIEVKFPEIEGWTKGNVSGGVTEQMGLIAPYNAKSSAIATIYVYDRGIQKIPDDLSGVVETEFKETKDSLYRLVQMGLYKSVKEVKSETSTLGGAKGKVKALHAIFIMKMKGTDTISEIYLFSYKNYFVNITLTQPKAVAGEELKKELENFVAAMDTLFAA